MALYYTTLYRRMRSVVILVKSSALMSLGLPIEFGFVAFRGGAKAIFKNTNLVPRFSHLLALPEREEVRGGVLALCNTRPKA